MYRLYCRASDIITDQATISLTVGAVNAAFPLANIQDRRPGKPTKTTGTTATIRATFGAPVVLEMVSFGPHNLAGATVTLTNNSGLSVSMPVAANYESGLSRNPFLDLTSILLATRTASQWNLVITGAAANIAIGEWQLITTKRALNIWPATGGGTGAGEGQRFRTVTIPTDYDDDSMKYSFGVKRRTFTCRIRLESERAAMLSLHDDAKGSFRSFLFVPDSSVNDAHLVTAPDELTFTRQLPTPITEVDIEFLEVQRGVAL